MPATSAKTVRERRTRIIQALSTDPTTPRIRSSASASARAPRKPEPSTDPSTVCAYKAAKSTLLLLPLLLVREDEDDDEDGDEEEVRAAETSAQVRAWDSAVRWMAFRRSDRFWTSWLDIVGGFLERSTRMVELVESEWK